MIQINKRVESAISPVIGILLMIVVTLIVAAIVSGFSGSLISSEDKAPQAQISGEFSLSDGFIIKHEGGDPLATKDMIITVKNSRLFGPDVEGRTAQLINKMKVTDSTGEKLWEYADGSSDVTSFNAGDTALISTTNCTCNILQPVIAPHGGSYEDDGLTYSGATGGKRPFWMLCFRNSENLGKTFIMEVTDKATGKMISKTDVPITS